MAVVFVSSSLSPVPRLNVPEITVRCSAVGCQWAATLYPSGAFNRIVNIPVFPGSPWRTAIFAPAGILGGASPHLISPSPMMTCVGFAAAAGFFAAAAFFSCAEALHPKTQRQPRASAKTTAFLIAVLLLLNAAARAASRKVDQIVARPLKESRRPSVRILSAKPL